MKPLFNIRPYYIVFAIGENHPVIKLFNLVRIGVGPHVGNRHGGAIAFGLGDFVDGGRRGHGPLSGHRQYLRKTTGAMLHYAKLVADSIPADGGGEDLLLF